jgi:hypothetical protein
MGTWVHGYMGTWVHGYLGTWVQGYMGTWVRSRSSTPLTGESDTQVRSSIAPVGYGRHKLSSTLRVARGLRVVRPFCDFEVA